MREKKRYRMIQIENSEADRSEGVIQAGEGVFCVRRRRGKPQLFRKHTKHKCVERKS